MEFQQQMDNHIKAMRAATLSNSPQLTLGELILKLEALIPAQKSRKEEADIVFDFEYFFPTKLTSWRGSYAELALCFASDGPIMKFTPFLEMLKESIGKSFCGYKGGDFIMSKHTPIWVANYGHSGNTGVVGVLNKDYNIYLQTAYCEY